MDGAVVNGVLETDAKQSGETIAIAAAGNATITVSTIASVSAEWAIAVAKGSVMLLKIAGGAVGVGGQDSRGKVSEE